jgi:hypothetical protein
MMNPLFLTTEATPINRVTLRSACATALLMLCCCMQSVVVLAGEKPVAETPEHKEKAKAHWFKMGAIAESQIHQLQFVGRILDQYGIGVSDAQVWLRGGSNSLARGSGTFSVQTDKDGFFVVDNATGSFLDIREVTKVGYDTSVMITVNDEPPESPHFYSFKESDDAMLWSDYTREHPYVITAWRVGKYAKVKTEKDRGLGFVPNGAVYTLDFTGTDTVRWEGTRDGDIRVSITRNDKEWKVVIEGIDGGVQEASDTYMNLAPESGYQKSLTFSGQAKEDFDHSNGIVTTKKIYFISQHGKRYGSASLEMRPYFDEDTVIYTSYTINLEGGRELAVKPKE